MTLKYFIEWLWTRKNLTVILCKDEDYSAMFTEVDRIVMQNKSIENILEFIICAFVPYLTELNESEYICEKLMSSKVTNFCVTSTYMIIWIKEEDENE